MKIKTSTVPTSAVDRHGRAFNLGGGFRTQEYRERTDLRGSSNFVGRLLFRTVRALPSRLRYFAGSRPSL
jgi:hypothetical protein